MSLQKQLLWSLLLLAVLAVILLISNYYEGRTVDIPRIVFGSVCLLFLPGYRVTKALFAESEIDLLEIIALSFAFSISVIPLLVFYLNLMGLPITQRLVWGTCLVVIGASSGWKIWKGTQKISGIEKSDNILA